MLLVVGVGGGCEGRGGGWRGVLGWGVVVGGRGGHGWVGFYILEMLGWFMEGVPFRV